VSFDGGGGAAGPADEGVGVPRANVTRANASADRAVRYTRGE
jgi:hypothetical protein